MLRSEPASRIAEAAFAKDDDLLTASERIDYDRPFFEGNAHGRRLNGQNPFCNRRNGQLSALPSDHRPRVTDEGPPALCLQPLCPSRNLRQAYEPSNPLQTFPHDDPRAVDLGRLAAPDQWLYAVPPFRRLAENLGKQCLR